jgi:Photosynthetic reaction centre cytochrome C subunit
MNIRAVKGSQFQSYMFLPYKKIVAFSGLAGFTLLGILAAKPPQEEKTEYKNLQVISKKISDKDMDYVMESMGVDLGVNCMFCHVSHQKGYEFSFDYASDSLMNKRVSRDMLRMTMKLNKKYFNVRLTSLMNTRGRVWCKTCHQGKPIPIFSH